jgi:hypothetical protein
MGSMTSPVRLGVVSQTDGARICLVPVLHTYANISDRWLHLPSCVPSLLSASKWVGSYTPKGDSPLATSNWNGRAHSGTGISTGCASTTPFGLALAPDSPWED